MSESTDQPRFTPFANGTESLNIDDFTIENHPDRLSLYGSLDITCDKEGLEKTYMLAALFIKASHFLAKRMGLK